MFLILTLSVRQLCPGSSPTLLLSESHPRGEPRPPLQRCSSGRPRTAPVQISSPFWRRVERTGGRWNDVSREYWRDRRTERSSFSRGRCILTDGERGDSPTDNRLRPEPPSLRRKTGLRPLIERKCGRLSMRRSDVVAPSGEPGSGRTARLRPRQAVLWTQFPLTKSYCARSRYSSHPKKAPPTTNVRRS